MRLLFAVVFVILGMFCKNAIVDEVVSPPDANPHDNKDRSVDTDNEFTTLTNDYWNWRLKEEPEMSTRFGNYKYNDKLESFKYNVFTERLEQARSFLEKLSKLDSTKLSPKQQISYGVLEDTLMTYVDGYKWKDYGNINPFNFMEGFHTNPSGYTLNIPFDTQGDFLNYVKRVELLSQQVDEKLELARKALDFGHSYHNVSVNRIPTQLDDVIADHPTKFALYKPLDDYASEVFVDDISNIRSYIDQRLKRAIGNLLDKLRELKTFITTVYMPNTRKGLGVSHLVNGSDYYKACLKWHTSLDISPEEVHQKGLNEVDRIAKEMEKVIVRLKFPAGTTTGEAFAAMANDSQVLINDGEKTLERFREIIFQRIQPKLQKYFKNIPQLPLLVKNSPSDGISGQYRTGSEDGTVPGIFYANVRRPEDNPTYSMISLSLHEALPGHHLAESYGMTSDLPNFRKNYNWRTYSVPFHFPYFNSYVEGWGLYSEYLGEEMGVYENDYELMGRYSDEMWRACRLVIDTGIHYYNWTREQAINYMLNYTANSRNSAEIEVDRYATWPGQACGYKIGEIKLKELRRYAEDTLGDVFDIRDFHYVVLSNGPVPLGILENIVEKWIDSNKEATKHSEKTHCETSGTTSTIQRNITTLLLITIIFVNNNNFG